MHIPQRGGTLRRAIVPSVLVIFFLICVPGLRADPIAFEINWLVSSGSPGPLIAPATTAYTFDSNGAFFAGFVVSWDGLTYDFASLLNSAPEAFRIGFQSAMSNPAGNQWSVGPFFGSDSSFRLFTGDPEFQLSAPPIVPPGGSSVRNFTNSGGYTVVQTSVPEPATLTLCGIGLGGLLLSRYASSKRRNRPSKG